MLKIFIGCCLKKTKLQVDVHQNKYLTNEFTGQMTQTQNGQHMRYETLKMLGIHTPLLSYVVSLVSWSNLNIACCL